MIKTTRVAHQSRCKEWVVAYSSLHSASHTRSNSSVRATARLRSAQLRPTCDIEAIGMDPTREPTQGHSARPDPHGAPEWPGERVPQHHADSPNSAGSGMHGMQFAHKIMPPRQPHARPNTHPHTNTHALTHPPLPQSPPPPPSPLPAASW